jgi:hypothetical protein
MGQGHLWIVETFISEIDGYSGILGGRREKIKK